MTITTLNKKAIAVTGLPEGVTCTIANNVINDGCITLIVKDKHGNNTWHKLPEGNWSILGRAADLTEDDWKRVVEKMPWGEECYKNYELEDNKRQYVGKYPTESGHSLLKAKGLHVTNDPKPDIEDYLTGRQYQHFLNIWQSANELTNPLILIK